MIANNTGEVIESDEYGEAVFHVILTFLSSIFQLFPITDDLLFQQG